MLAEYKMIEAPHIAKCLGMTQDEWDKVKIHPALFEHLNYHFITGQEKQDLMQEISRTIKEENLRTVGANDNAVWEQGWNETLQLIEKTPQFKIELLAPKYFEKHTILRFCGEYIRTDTIQFIYHYDQIIRKAIFTKYLSYFNRVIEIGCGTGNSQILLAQIIKNKSAELVASDWSSASQRLLQLVREKTGINLVPVNFNMLTLEGKEALAINNQSAVLTVHALEQLGENYKPLLNLLLTAKPAICVHIEPIIEFYQQDNLFDRLAMQYHQKRNYLGSWLSDLRELQMQGKVDIIEERRIGFGDRFHEAYGLVVWKPLL